MEKSEIFKSRFPDFKGTIGFYTEDCRMASFVDAERDIVEFATAPMSRAAIWPNASLSETIDGMSDMEFERFIECLPKK